MIYFLLISENNCKKRSKKWVRQLNSYVSKILKSGIGPFSQYTNFDKSKKNYTVKKSSKAMVVSDDIRCSRVGLYQIKKGGNAIDAAVATQFCLSVIDLQSSGIIINIFFLNVNRIGWWRIFIIFN